MSSLTDILKNDIEIFISKFIDEVSIETNINKNRLHEIWMNLNKSSSKSIPSMTTIKKKKTVSSYVNFCNKQRPILKEKYPNLSFGEISKQLGKLWSELSTEEQNKYKIVVDDDENNNILPPELPTVIEKQTNDNFIFYDKNNDDDDDESIETFIIDEDDDFDLLDTDDD
jgi:hypothetical protein